MQRLGQKIRVLRQRHHLTLRELAAELGISYSNLAEIETSKHLPSVTVLVQLADFFAVSVDSLVKDELEVR